MGKCEPDERLWNSGFDQLIRLFNFLKQFRADVFFQNFLLLTAQNGFFDVFLRWNRYMCYESRSFRLHFFVATPIGRCIFILKRK